MMVKFSQERNVRSLAKKTLGSTRVGRAIRLPVDLVSMLLKMVDHDKQRLDCLACCCTYLELSGGGVV